MEQKITTDKITVDGETKENYDGVYYGNRDLKRKIFYMCNQKKCETCSAKNGECKHTTDIRYAAHYFTTPPNKTLEKYFDKEYMILDEPTVIFIERIGENEIL